MILSVVRVDYCAERRGADALYAPYNISAAHIYARHIRYAALWRRHAHAAADYFDVATMMASMLRCR